MSKDLVVSGYTMDTLPSSQEYLDENLLVHAKGIHSMYFILDPSFSPEVGLHAENGIVINVSEVHTIPGQLFCQKRLLINKSLFRFLL